MSDDIVDMNSILDYTKHGLGISPDYPVFDPNIIMSINSAFNTLSQLGVRPDSSFAITDSKGKWSDYLSNEPLLNLVKQYVVIKTRLEFDPPTTSFAIESFTKMRTEYEWRINVMVENLPEKPPTFDSFVKQFLGDF